ncbi:hypothetical protein ACE2AJ_00440 [Aquihabitans daechungensis]|uniref:hypothetical protein n=1 Tax=Aquihabitans daechungensis TaxID=1052257 RepID=UPI003B9DF028
MGRGIQEILTSGVLEDRLDTRLAFMMDVWGPLELEDFAAWCLRGENEGGSEPPRTQPQTHAGSALFGNDKDPLHLSDHWSIPTRPLADALAATSPYRWTGMDPGTLTAAIILDRYDAWSARLDELGSQLPQPEAGEEQWEVDVVVRPVGWLGTYRQSRETGLWFAGSHIFHSMAHG